MAAVSLENWEERIRDPKVECMSSDEMAALQSKRLVDVVKRVYDHVDFYHKKMKETGVEPGDIRSIEDINKLPFTTKEDLRANYPFGLLAIPQSDVVRVQGTSGTTGKLTIAPYSQKDVEVWGECVARCLTMAGLTKDDILHVCYGYGLFTGGLGLDFGARALGAMTIPMSAGNTRRQMMVMEDLGATAFACTPSYALYLAESIQEAGLTDRLKIRAESTEQNHGQKRCVKKLKIFFISTALIFMDYVRLPDRVWQWIVSIMQDFMSMRIISILKY